MKPWLIEEWVLPTAASGAFVGPMEDVLEVYSQPHDPRRPVVCVDETSKQLVGHVREPLPPQPGQPARQDYEYERQGTANLFMVFEALAGRREVVVTEPRTQKDFAALLPRIADEMYPLADKVVLVMDNLNTHHLGALYEAFAPAEARRLWERFEVHDTPKHGSWLNLAECELSVLSRQCLDRRISSRADLEREVAAWQAKRNETKVRVDWQFRTADARVKLKRLYPVLEPVESARLDH